MNLVMLGPPGAGKGTQAAPLRDELGLPHLSTGDLLRRHRAEATALGRAAAGYMDRGQLVPDELVIGVLTGAVNDPPRGLRARWLSANHGPGRGAGTHARR